MSCYWRNEKVYNLHNNRNFVFELKTGTATRAAGKENKLTSFQQKDPTIQLLSGIIYSKIEFLNVQVFGVECGIVGA